MNTDINGLRRISMMRFTFQKSMTATPDFLCLPVFEGKVLPKHCPLTPEVLAQVTAVLARQKFSGKHGEMLPLYTTDPQIVLMGFGKEKEATIHDVAAMGAKTQRFLEGTLAKTVAVFLPSFSVKDDVAASEFAFGMRLWSYNFDKYKTKTKAEDKPKLENVTLVLENAASAETLFQEASFVAEGIFLNRDLLNEPCNILNPKTFAERTKELEKLGVVVTVLEAETLRKMGMNCILAVGEGSKTPPCIVVMEWKGCDKGGKPVAFCGKGVTFDTGGISLKPGSKMDEMKYDMGGAAAVTSLIKTLALAKAKVNVVGVIGLVENMPDGAAYRPGDVLVSYSGQTVEILNTDAEGRVVLSDVLWYTQDTYKPQIMVDLATLTGAIITALGHEFAGLFSNNDVLANQITAAGTMVDEKVWRLPLTAKFDKGIDSKIADVKNLGPGAAGSITAAQFLQRFVGDTPWAHLDIAGMSMFDGGIDHPLSRHSATGYGTRLLYQFVKDTYLAG